MHSVFLVLALAAQVPPAPAAVTASEPDLEELMARARLVQEADAAAWGRLVFHRRAVSEQLDREGTVTDREDLEFLVRPDGDGFDELLLRIDGRDPSKSEIDHHRKAARFERRYTRMRAGEGEDEEMGYSMGLLLKMSTYHYGGRETIEGHDCHRIEFEGKPGNGSGIADRVAASMGGTIWLEADGGHIVRAIASSRKPVSAFLSLARVSELTVSLESVPGPGGDWVPSSIQMNSAGRVLRIRFSRRYLYEYRNYSAPALPESPIR